ncbi:MAG: hypothetical protein MJY60_03885 [Bacteroidales bacterium]|nr:hypothetical protein [Bacteroidales bacterium]
MIRQYDKNEERIEAFRQAVALRQKWSQAVREGASREQMEGIGLFMPKVIEE